MIGCALIGYGYWGPNIARVLHESPRTKLRWCCDLEQGKLGKFARRYPGANTTTRVADVLDDAETELVCVVTPISTHFDLAARALERGKHVFVEKPLAASTDEAQKLVKLAAKHKRILMVGHVFEYSPPVRKIKEILDRNELGKIHYISCTRVNLGIHQKDVSVIWDLAPHDVSILLYLLGEEPRRVSAMGRACIQKRIPDVAFMNLEFPSGVIAHVEISWLSPSKIRNTIVVGSKKMLIYDDTQISEKVKIFDHGVNYHDPETFGEFHLSYRTGDIVSPKVDTYEPLSAEIEHLLDCVEKGTKPVSDGLSGLRAVRVLESADRSLANGGKPVAY
ncbi:MAG: Gfo/Idh/MocA family oxidoreductase [Planctomycetota bacterium]|nr:Gfo/Idh/MocA family oxidoreductase [Planctomycetota bacterium]